MKKYLSAIIGAFVLIFIDQYTKILALTHLKDQDPFVIWDGVFELCYLENRGAAFGILQNQQLFFIVMTTVVMCLLTYIFLKIPMNRRYHLLHGILVLLFAGAVGNWIDRLINGYVVDFFYFKLIDFPIPGKIAKRDLNIVYREKILNKYHEKQFIDFVINYYKKK